MSNNNVDPNFDYAKFREEVRKVIEGIEGQFAGKTWANVAEEEGLFDKIDAAAEAAVHHSVAEAAAGGGGGSAPLRPGGATIVAIPAPAKTESVKINGVPVSQWLASKKPLRINGKTVKEWLAIKKDKRPIFNGPGAAPSPGIQENNSPSLLVTGFDTNKYDLDDFVLIASLGGPVRDVFKPEGKNYLFVEMVGPEAAKRVKHLFAETELKIGGRKILFDVSDRSSAARYKGRKPGGGGGGGGGAAAGAAKGKKRQGGGAMTMKNGLNTAKHFLSNKLSVARNTLRVGAKRVNKIGREMGSYAVEKATSMQKPLTDPLATVKATAKEINEKVQATAKNLANKAKRSITRKNRN